MNHTVKSICRSYSVQRPRASREALTAGSCCVVLILMCLHCVSVVFIIHHYNKQLPCEISLDPFFIITNYSLRNYRTFSFLDTNVKQNSGSVSDRQQVVCSETELNLEQTSSEGLKSIIYNKLRDLICCVFGLARLSIRGLGLQQQLQTLTSILDPYQK